ncbi:papain-like cysteine protease family protein [Burkholderia sp. Ac-20365]|uniref:papain-like cysteine protease family protein n=1 Tax=Burkholderia sp. Ac-20365 TaxID=2703897 RepID=UPI00197C2A7F|nr:papain-like cysteine protease family protein [Burkholderia sp. Ac-20365]MBN3760734.1 DUF3238 domain-containing protein [Burkholderia sp. Ac-20365]
MPVQIRPTRLEVSDRFPMLGFSIRTDGPPQRVEVAIGAEPGLFSREGKSRRSASNFYSTRVVGPLQIAAGQGVYVVPPEVLARLVGNERLYYGLAIQGDDPSSVMKVAVSPAEGSPYVSLKGLSARSMQRVRVIPNRQQRAAGYGNVGPGSLDWAGDDATPGMEPAGGKNGHNVPPTGNGSGTPDRAPPPPPPAPYDDGFGPMPVSTSPTSPMSPVSGSPDPRSPAPIARDPSDLPAPPARSMEASPITITGQQQPVTPPSVRQLDSVQKALILSALAAASGPVGLAPLLATFPVAARAAGVSIGIGPSVGGGLGAGGALGCGLIYGPDGELGAYGSAEVDIGFITSIGATVQITVTRGGIASFNGWSMALAISGGEGVVGGASALFDTIGNFQGISASVGIGAGFSPVDFYVAAQRSVSTQLGMAASLGYTRSALTSARIARAPGRISRGLASDTGQIELRYRMFIPSPLIDSPTAVWEGDGRDFAFDGGTSRGEVRAIVRLTPGGGIAGIDVLDRHWGKSCEYASSDAHHVDGKPSWWLDRNEGAQPLRCDTLAVTDGNLRIYAGASGTTRPAQAIAEGASIVTIEASGALPLSPIAPAIDADISVMIRATGDGLEVKVEGEHDGFPCHELYANGVCIYIFDPVATGSSPLALLPPMDITVSTPWTQIGPMVPSSAGMALSDDACSLNWDEVESVAQPTDASCWATAAAMIIGWRDRVSVTPGFVAGIGQRSISRGLDPADMKQFASDVGLAFEYPVSYTADALRALLERNGPLFVTAAVPGLHAIVVTGLYSGAPDASTYVRITDPWDRAVGTPGAPGAPGSYLSTHATGSRYIMKWQDFVSEYERAAIDYSGVTLQILSSGPQTGRIPNRGTSTPVGYAQQQNDSAPPTNVQFDARAWPTTAPTSLEPQDSAASGDTSAQRRLDIWQGSLQQIAGNVSTALTHLPALARTRSWTIAITGGPSSGIALGSAIGAGIALGADGRSYTFGPAQSQQQSSAPASPGAPGDIPRIDQGTLQFTVVEGEDAASITRWTQAVRFRADDARVHNGAVLLAGNGTFIGVTFGLNPLEGLSPESVFDAVKAAYAQGAGQPPSITQALRARQLAQTPTLESPPPQTPLPAGTLRRVTGSMNGVTWDLMQFDGMKVPANGWRDAGVGVSRGAKVDLGDWPYINAVGPAAAAGQRSCAPLSIDWSYQAGAVGDIRITPGALSTFDGRSITVEATVADGTDTPEMVSLRVHVRTTFSRAGEADDVAVTSVTLFGDGRPPVREDAWEMAGTKIAA